MNGWEIGVAEPIQAGTLVRFCRKTETGTEYAEGLFKIYSAEGLTVMFEGAIPAGITKGDFVEFA